jgi:hypothetical protein
MQDRSILCDIDLVAPEHGFDPLSKARFLGQLNKELEGFVGDPILGVIQEQPGGLDSHALTALWVFRKQLT